MERYLIVGLGNPGRKYSGTRHNIGFHTVEEIAATYNLKFDTKKSNAEIAEGIIVGKRVLLVKPQTFMNLSGQSVRGLADFYKVSIENIIVIHDDIDIDLGVLRLRPKGGAGGHNGIRSIIDHLGGQNFARIRFGVGRPPGKMDPAAFVLRPFTEPERLLVLETMRRATHAIEIWLTEGIEMAMNKQNGTAEEVAERQRKTALSNQPETTSQDTPPSK